MITKQQIERLVQEKIEGTDIFLVDLTVSATNKIMVYVDTDKGITIKDCVAVSRHIESNLDREKEDFELEVSSPGIEYPFMVKRQYIKNTGRYARIRMKDGRELEGRIVFADNDKVEFAPDKPKKKKKDQVEIPDKVEISYDDIAEAKGIVKF